MNIFHFEVLDLERFQLFEMICRSSSVPFCICHVILVTCICLEKFNEKNKIAETNKNVAFCAIPVQVCLVLKLSLDAGRKSGKMDLAADKSRSKDNTSPHTTNNNNSEANYEMLCL